MAADGADALPMGRRCRLHSLNSIVYNGMLAEVIGWDHASGRFMLRLDGSGKEMKVKPENVAFDDPDDAPPAAMAAAMSDKRHGQQGGAAASTDQGVGVGACVAFESPTRNISSGSGTQLFEKCIFQTVPCSRPSALLLTEYVSQQNQRLLFLVLLCFSISI